MYAIISDRNRQHAVREGDVITCDLMEDQEPGKALTFDQVLLVSSEGNVTVGTPMVDGATVTAEIVGPLKGPKLTVFRFKRRKNVRVKRGHRQKHTQVRITSINA